MSTVAPRRPSVRRWRWVAAAVAVLVTTGLGGCVVVGEVLIRPWPTVIGPPPPDLPAREVTVRSETGRDVHGWLVPGGSDGAGVLLVHGLHSDRRSMVPRARFLHRLGYTVLLIDLQAHGESPGEHITFGDLEARDVRAAAGYLREAVAGRPVAAIGVSLGGAAILLTRPPVPFAAVVLESVYSTFDEALDNRMRQTLGPPGPVLSGALAWQLPMRLGISSRDLRPVDRIRQLHSPLLLVQGDVDRNATLPQARRLFAAAPGPDKQLWVVPGAGHVDLYGFAPLEYRARVTAFLAQHLPTRTPTPITG